MKCENCIHYECCCDWVSSEDLKDLGTGENCATYKDKSLFVEPVRCKDCVYYQCEKVLMSNGELRDYTEQEIKEGKCVSLDKGINLGSRCLRFRYWEENSIPVWFNDNDYCSYGKKLKEIEDE